MGGNIKYSLLVYGDKKLIDELNLKNNNYIYYYANESDLEHYYFDVILNMETLEIRHGYNLNLINKFSNLVSLNKYLCEDLLKDIKAIDFDTSLALDMLGDSTKAFINILKTYLETYGNLNKDVNDLLSNYDFHEIRKIIHKIKGVSLYLGSEKLLKISSETESKLYNGLASGDDIKAFLLYHNRVLKYVKEQVENV